MGTPITFVSRLLSFSSLYIGSWRLGLIVFFIKEKKICTSITTESGPFHHKDFVYTTFRNLSQKFCLVKLTIK